MAQSPEEMAQSMIDNLKANTGKTLACWLKVVRAAKHEKHGAIVKHLKTEHSVTHGYANLIAHKALAGEAPVSGDDLIAKQYSGAKEDLRPIYEALTSMVGKFGKDVEISAKKTYVSLRRSKQFAIVQPSTRTCVDLGLNLKGVPPTARFEKSGNFNAMVSHRVRIETLRDVNKEIRAWLRKAYEMA